MILDLSQLEPLPHTFMLGPLAIFAGIVLLSIAFQLWSSAMMATLLTEMDAVDYARLKMDGFVHLLLPIYLDPLSARRILVTKVLMENTLVLLLRV
jgi:hypothetical protein